MGSAGATTCFQVNRRALALDQDSASHVGRFRIEALKRTNANRYVHKRTPPPDSDSPTLQSDSHTSFLKVVRDDTY
jgi:hypothetical protein